MLGTLQRRTRPELENSAESPPIGDLQSDIEDENVVDHSGSLANDFAKFLFEEQLSDVTIKVRKLKTMFGESVVPSGQSVQFVQIPAHKVVLASRCSYFYSRFCRDWADNK